MFAAPQLISLCNAASHYLAPKGDDIESVKVAAISAAGKARSSSRTRAKQLHTLRNRTKTSRRDPVGTLTATMLVIALQQQENKNMGGPVAHQGPNARRVRYQYRSASTCTLFATCYCQPLETFYLQTYTIQVSHHSSCILTSAMEDFGLTPETSDEETDTHILDNRTQKDTHILDNRTQKDTHILDNRTQEDTHTLDARKQTDNHTLPNSRKQTDTHTLPDSQKIATLPSSAQKIATLPKVAQKIATLPDSTRKMLLSHCLLKRSSLSSRSQILLKGLSLTSSPSMKAKHEGPKHDDAKHDDSPAAKKDERTRSYVLNTAVVDIGAVRSKHATPQIDTLKVTMLAICSQSNKEIKAWYNEMVRSAILDFTKYKYRSATTCNSFAIPPFRSINILQSNNILQKVMEPHTTRPPDATQQTHAEHQTLAENQNHEEQDERRTYIITTSY